jgi:U3 small nucleolar RNA-associated protein 13
LFQIQTTPNGKQFVVEYEGNIKIISVDDPSDWFTLLSDEVEHEAITTFALHPNGKEIVVATAKFSISHYNIEDRVCTRTIRAHRMPILCMDYDPTGTLVATGSSDRSVRVWDVAKGYCTHSFSVHTDIVKTVFFHPDPNRLELFSTSDDNSIAMFDLRDQKCVAQFKDHFSLPTQVALSPDGYILISCGRDKVSDIFQHIFLVCDCNHDNLLVFK